MGDPQSAEPPAPRSEQIRGAEMVNEQKTDNDDEKELLELRFNGRDAVICRQLGTDPIQLDRLSGLLKNQSNKGKYSGINLMIPQGNIEGASLHRLILLCQEQGYEVILTRSGGTP